MIINKTTGTCSECKKHFDNGYYLLFNKTIFKKAKLCELCAKKLYQNLSMFFVPKSPKNIICKKKKN